MGKLVVLGSACAVPDAEHENTHLALVGQQDFVLVDCAGQPVVRLRRAGLDFHRLSDLIVTHFHPDHAYGVPMLLMEMWLRGRTRPLTVHALPHCLERVERLMHAYESYNWPGLFPVTYHALETQDGAPVLETEDYRITSASVRHFVPCIGLRVQDRRSGRVMAYSCDTEPCPGDHFLARQADLFIHEATGQGMGHASAAQAGEVAAQAGAGHLVLIHYCADGRDTASLVPEARTTFRGPVTLAQDFMTLEW